MVSWLIFFFIFKTYYSFVLNNEDLPVHETFTNLGKPFEIIEEEVAFHGIWTNFTRLHFVRKDRNKTGIWEMIDMPQYSDDRVNGVQLIPRILLKNRRHYVFNLQFRISLRGWTLEFPGGGVENGESNIEGALRELKEETGYTATQANALFSTHGKLATHPGKTNDLIQLTVVDIDAEVPENQHIQQNLDDEEASYVRLIAEDELLETLIKIEKQVYIASNVYAFAIGHRLATDGFI